MLVTLWKINEETPPPHFFEFNLVSSVAATEKAVSKVGLRACYPLYKKRRRTGRQEMLFCQ